MTLATLKKRLTTAITGIFEQLYFDYSDVLNTNLIKSYPYVAWNLDTAKGSTSLRKVQKLLDLEVIGVIYIDPNIHSFLDKYDEVEALLMSYIASVNTQNNIQVMNESADIEYYPRGTISNDSEVGVKLKIQLKLWC